MCRGRGEGGEQSDQDREQDEEGARAGSRQEQITWDLVGLCEDLGFAPSVGGF